METPEPTQTEVSIAKNSPTPVVIPDPAAIAAQLVASLDRSAPSNQEFTTLRWREMAMRKTVEMLRTYGLATVEAQAAELDKLKFNLQHSREQVASYAGMVGRIQGVIDLAFPNSRHAEFDVLPGSVRELWQRLVTAERTLAELRERERWIPVSEKLPDSRTWVIGCCEHVGTRYVSPVYGVTITNDNGRFKWESEFRVTHWRPLPAPPDPTT